MAAGRLGQGTVRPLREVSWQREKALILHWGLICITYLTANSRRLVHCFVVLLSFAQTAVVSFFLLLRVELVFVPLLFSAVDSALFALPCFAFLTAFRSRFSPAFTHACILTPLSKRFENDERALARQRASRSCVRRAPTCSATSENPLCFFAAVEGQSSSPPNYAVLNATLFRLS